MENLTDIDLLMIGKTGNGKSATGNSILRRRAFVSKSSTTSVTIDAAYEVTEFDGRVIKVVDGPGIGDNRMNVEKARNIVIRAIEYAIAANPRGYHAFLLVVRFGGRFTDEDQDTVEFLKKLFGEDFVKKFCILVMTCGKNFEEDNEGTGKTFHQWCEEQEGVFRNLYLECERRAVLFDNTTKSEEIKRKQLAELLKIVDHLASKGKRYTDENFVRAEKTRQTVVIEAKLPVIQEKTEKETSLILFRSQELLKETDLKVKVKKLEDLFVRVETLYNGLKDQDRGTGALSQLCSTVKSLKRSLNDDLKFYIRMIDEEKEQKKIEESIRRQCQEEMRKQKEEYERKLANEQQEKNKNQEQLISEQLEKEFHKKMKIAEEKKGQDIENLYKKLEKEKEAEIKRQQQNYESLENEYKKAKTENNSGIMNAIVDTVTWPFRKIGNWLF